MMGYDPAAYQQLYAQQQAAFQQVAQAAAGYSQYPGYNAGSAGGQQPQAAAQQAPQQAAPTAPVECVGQTAHLAVNGCTHQTVGGIVRGHFTANGQNHGKPTYKKDQQVNGLDVMLYFWDERDGPNFCGWWFGPKVGGDQVWAYHPSKQSLTPPTKGWKVPYDGPIDDTFSITPASAQQAQAAQNYQNQGGYQQQQQQQGPGGYGGHQQQVPEKGPWGPMPVDDHQRHELQAQNRRQHEQKRAMQKREEEMRQQQQAEAMRKAAAEKAAQEEQQRKIAEARKKEQDACSAIRTACQKLRSVQEDAFPRVQQELHEVMQRELNNCGPQMASIRQECDKIIEQTARRIQEAAEVRAFQEKKKAEAHKAAVAKAEQLVADFTAKVEAAEAAANDLAEKSEPFMSDEVDLAETSTEEQILEESAKIDQAREVATARTIECQEFLNEHRSTMTVPDLSGQPPSEVKQVLAKVMEKLMETTKKKDAVMLKIHLVKSKALKKSKAKRLTKESATKFNKYAKEGVLDKKQVIAYSKKEFGFAVSEAAVTKILKALQSTKGVAAKDFQRLKVQIGILREKAKDQVRRKQREEHEAKLAADKEELKEKIAELATKAEAAEASVKKAEEAIEQLTKVDGELRSSELLQKCSEASSTMKAAQSEIAEVRASAAEMREGAEADLKAWLSGELRPIDSKCQGYERRLREVAIKNGKAEGEAKQKELQEVAACEKKALVMLKHHRKVKELTAEATVAAIAGDAETVGKDSFLAFFESCEKEEGEAAPSKEDLGKYFDQLDDESEGFLTKEHVLTLARTLKKVVNSTTITDTEEVSEETKTLAKLEAGDVLELLSEPTEQGEMLRAKCRSMKDGTEGWVTMKGSGDTVFVAEGGNVWKVQKETILTKGFDISSSADADRKLKPNELVDLREWMRKDEGSGLRRMKCKAQSDGKVGWVTAVGNTGTVFVTPQ